MNTLEKAIKNTRTGDRICGVDQLRPSQRVCGTAEKGFYLRGTRNKFHILRKTGEQYQIIVLSRIDENCCKQTVTSLP